MAKVTLEGIEKSYGPVSVLRGIDLEIAKGELVVLVGPSGCGKSTLLRGIAGLEPFTSGSLKIGKREVSGLPPKDRDIAMVFQSYALYPHLSVRDNLAFGLKLKKMSKAAIDERVKEVSEMLGLESLLQRRPAKLSGGQRQRVAMGRAIARRPKVFLFDEPLSNLDAKLRTKVRLEIRELHRRLGTTMIYVTHDQIEAMTLADRLVILNGGEVQQIGVPTDVYAKPANTFVASFLGTPPMNLLPVGAAHIDGPRPEAETLGVRAHELSSEALPNATVPLIEGQVSALEPLGAETFAYVDYGGEVPLLARHTAQAAPQIGERARYYAAPNHLHYFDQNGQRL